MLRNLREFREDFLPFGSPPPPPQKKNGRARESSLTGDVKFVAIAYCKDIPGCTKFDVQLAFLRERYSRVLKSRQIVQVYGKEFCDQSSHFCYNTVPSDFHTESLLANAWSSICWSRVCVDTVDYATKPHEFILGTAKVIGITNPS